MTGISGRVAFSGSNIPDHVSPESVPGLCDMRVSLDGPFFGRFGNVVVTFSGRPRFERTDDPEIVLQSIAEAWRAEQESVLDRISGPFAIILVDAESEVCMAAIDRMGVERLAWGQKGSWITLGTSASTVARDLTGRPRLNSQALFDFMYSHMVPAPLTIFEDVHKLQPGTAIKFSSNGARSFRYWQPDFDRARQIDIDALRRETLPVLRRAIERTNPDSSTGSFLSGGLDSSTVTGLLADVQDQRAKAFSVGFGVDEFDEMEFARAAASKFDCEHLVYEVVPADIVDLIPKIAAAYDEPFGNSSAVPTFCCARLAREHGVDHLLAGDAGDELFGGNERYVRQRVFELYSRLPAWLRRQIIEPLADRIHPEDGVFPFRKASSYVRQARIPLPERYETWNLIYREGAENIFSGDFLKSVDQTHVFHKMEDVWQACPSDDLLDRMLWFDWKFTLADNDLRKVGKMCELAGVRASFPMLDEEFVEHSIQVPSSEKISGYELRTFFKNAVRGFVPDIVISKKKHGFGLPFGVWLKTDIALQELVYGSIRQLRDRDLFDGGFLDRVIAEHRHGHAGYYGYAIWDLVMLEQWLEHHTTEGCSA